MCWNARGARVTCESLQPFILRTVPGKSWTASACLRVHHPLTRLCNPLKRTGSEDGKRPKPDSCAWVVNLAYPKRSFVAILPSWRPPAQHNTTTATFRSCVLPVPVLRSPLILLICKPIDGSMTRPPRMMRSYASVGSFWIRAASAPPAVVRMNDRRSITTSTPLGRDGGIAYAAGLDECLGGAPSRKSTVRQLFVASSGLDVPANSRRPSLVTVDALTIGEPSWARAPSIETVSPGCKVSGCHPCR